MFPLDFPFKLQSKQGTPTQQSSLVLASLLIWASICFWVLLRLRTRFLGCKRPSKRLWAHLVWLVSLPCGLAAGLRFLCGPQISTRRGLSMWSRHDRVSCLEGSLVGLCERETTGKARLWQRVFPVVSQRNLGLPCAKEAHFEDLRCLLLNFPSCTAHSCQRYWHLLPSAPIL